MAGDGGSARWEAGVEVVLAAEAVEVGVSVASAEEHREAGAQEAAGSSEAPWIEIRT